VVLGVLLYESRKCDEVESAFARFLELKLQMGVGWVIRGVCGYDRGSYLQAIEWIQEGVALGLGGNTKLQRATTARLAFALVKIGRFELSIEPLTPRPPVARRAGSVEATGLSPFRPPCLPSEARRAARPVQKLGERAAFTSGAGMRRRSSTSSSWPNTPRSRARYAYGVSCPERRHKACRVAARSARPRRRHDSPELAFELLLHGDNAEAKEHAMSRRPRPLFAARNALGRALVELGELTPASDSRRPCGSLPRAPRRTSPSPGPMRAGGSRTPRGARRVWDRGAPGRPRGRSGDEHDTSVNVTLNEGS
jgi:hypothetical protein